MAKNNAETAQVELQAEAAVKRFECVEDCIKFGRYVKKGDILFFDKEEVPHFKPAQEPLGL
jgi:hypothetical protein